MTEKPDGKRWGWGTWAWIVALLALYPLSSVPLWLFAKATGMPWLLVLNRPHDWIGDHCGAYQHFLQWYFRLLSH
jgi:hypothetical protein